MDSPAVKATMPTLAAGNKGFTLIEMLVVLAIIAIGTAGVSLSLRDATQSCRKAGCSGVRPPGDTVSAISRASSGTRSASCAGRSRR